MTTIRAYAPTGLSLSAHILNSNNQRLNTSTHLFEDYNPSNFSHYNIAFVEQGASGVYVATLPSYLQSGIYPYVVYHFIGSGSQTESDYRFLENGTVDTTTGISTTGIPIATITYSALWTFQKKDVGVKFLIPFVDPDGNALDISAATSIKIYVELPDRTKAAHDGAFLTDGTDGYVTWITTADTDLPEAGTYEIQGYIEAGTLHKYSQTQQFSVQDNLEPPPII